MFFSLTFIFPESPYYQQKHHNPPALERLQLWTQLRRFLTLGGGEVEERGAIDILRSLQDRKGWGRKH